MFWNIQALLFVIDGSVGTGDEDDPRSPLTDYMTLMNELKHYNKGLLLKKPSLIVKHFLKTNFLLQAVNKCDRKYVKFNEKINKLKVGDQAIHNFMNFNSNKINSEQHMLQ